MIDLLYSTTSQSVEEKTHYDEGYAPAPSPLLTPHVDERTPQAFRYVPSHQ